MVGARGLLGRVASVVVTTAVLLPGGARAGGALLYEVGTQDIGYASAGYGSRADAPVTLLTNPAGMTRLDGIQVEVGTEALFGAFTFAPDANTTVSGNNGGNAIGFFPNPSKPRVVDQLELRRNQSYLQSRFQGTTTRRSDSRSADCFRIAERTISSNWD